MSSVNTLIHLGLHKTGSTAIQTVWANMPNVDLSRDFCVETGNRLKDIIWGQSSDPFTLPDMPVFSHPAKLADGYRVLSAENLSNPNLDDFDAARYELFHEYAAQVFSKVVNGDAKLLVVVREPRSWLKSMYKQHIHTGGSETFRRFMITREEGLSYLLSLQYLDHWRAQFGADCVEILPYELMKESMAAFMKRLSENTGSPGLNANLNPKANISVGAAEGEFMRQTARSLKLIIDNSEITDPRIIPNLEKMKELVDAVLRWEMQDNPAGKLARLARRIDMKPDLDANLPEGLKKTINDKMIPQLKALSAFDGLVDDYAQE